MMCNALQQNFASPRNMEVREVSMPACSRSSRTFVLVGLHCSPQSFLGTTTAHSIPLADARKLTFFCREQTYTRSSTPPLPHFSANSFWRCVWLEPCSKVVDGQVQGSSVVPQCRLTSNCRIFFADGGITQLIERLIGEESSQVLLWPVRRSTLRGR